MYVQDFIFVAPILPGGEVGEAMLPHQTLSVNLIMFDKAGNYSQLICATMRFGFPFTTDRFIGKYRVTTASLTASRIKHINVGHIASNVTFLTLFSNSNIDKVCPFLCRSNAVTQNTFCFTLKL
jgi:hypothetical protein